MPADRKVNLFHSPQSRSAGAQVPPEEPGADDGQRTLDVDDHAGPPAVKACIRRVGSRAA